MDYSTWKSGEPVNAFAGISADGSTADFQIQLWGAPDFQTNPGGLFADQFVVVIDADRPGPGEHMGLAHIGAIPLGNMAVLMGPANADHGAIELAWLLKFPHSGTSQGGWGEVKALIPFSVTASGMLNTLSFSVPYALLRDDDQRFYFDVVLYHYGAGTALPPVNGISGERTPAIAVPEPSTSALLLGGLLALGTASRLRASRSAC